jgi:hypothetical protein
MARISLSLSGGFCPVSSPLFQGILTTAASSVAFMTLSFKVNGELVRASHLRALPDPLPPVALSVVQRQVTEWSGRPSKLVGDSSPAGAAIEATRR